MEAHRHVGVVWRELSGRLGSSGQTAASKYLCIFVIDSIGDLTWPPSIAPFPPRSAFLIGHRFAVRPLSRQGENTARPEPIRAQEHLSRTTPPPSPHPYAFCCLASSSTLSCARAAHHIAYSRPKNADTNAVPSHARPRWPTNVQHTSSRLGFSWTNLSAQVRPSLHLRLNP